MTLLLERLNRVMDAPSQSRAKPNTPLPDGVENSLNDLEKAVGEFVNLSEQLFSKYGYQPGEIEALLRAPARLEQKDQRVLHHFAQLKERAKNTYHSLTLAVQAVKKMGNLRSEDPAKRKQERQKRFGRIGGRKGWTPM